MTTRPAIQLVVSVDTEEDNWVPARRNIDTRNIRELPRLARVFEDLGVRPTYFTTYQVAADPDAAAIMKEVASSDSAELGAHLHPWNTPPGIGDSLDRFGTMLCRHPTDLQLAKLRSLTERLDTILDERPRSFRAGRFGFDASVVPALVACRYETDSSITPFMDWSRNRGPDFRETSPRVSSVFGQLPEAPPDTDLVEVPITVGFTRISSVHWPKLDRVTRHPLVTTFRIAGIGARLGMPAKAILSPETTSLKAMIRLADGALKEPLEYLHLFLHSSSLMPGLTPFGRSTEQVDRLYERLERFVRHLASVADLSFATVGEMAHRFRESQAAAPTPPGSGDPTAG